MGAGVEGLRYIGFRAEGEAPASSDLMGATVDTRVRFRVQSCVALFPYSNISPKVEAV